MNISQTSPGSSSQSHRERQPCCCADSLLEHTCPYVTQMTLPLALVMILIERVSSQTQHIPWPIGGCSAALHAPLNSAHVHQ